MRKKGKRQKTGSVLLALIFIILVSVSVGLVLFLHVDRVDELLDSGNVVTTLVVMENEGTVLFTDVFLYYPPLKKGALINILGNTGSIFKSLGRVARIDSVYSTKGIETYCQEVSELIGQPIPFYMLLKLEDFGELTDLLGGMKVFIPSSIDVKNEDGERWLLPGGAINLDGDKVNEYLAYHKPDDTPDEIDERRQNIVIAFFNALANNSRILRERKNFEVVFKKIQSNMKKDDLFRLVREFSLVDSERLAQQTITGSLRLVDGEMLLFPLLDGQFIKDVVKQSMASLKVNDDTNISRSYVVEILNGTAINGLARETSRILEGAGYDVFRVGNADVTDYDKTVIQSHIKNEESARNLGNFIRCENIITDDSNDSDSNVDFTIILGKDFDGRYVR